MEVELATPKKECSSPSAADPFGVDPTSKGQRSPKTGEPANDAKLPVGTAAVDCMEDELSLPVKHEDMKAEKHGDCDTGAGLLTREMIEEEKKHEQETEDEEEKERQKREELWRQLTEETREEKYARLQFLLSKSNMYTQYLMERMEKQKAEMKRRKERQQKRMEKFAEKQKAVIEKKTCDATAGDREGKENDPIRQQRTLRGKNSQTQPSSSQESQGSTGKGRRKRKQLESSDVSENSTSKKQKLNDQSESRLSDTNISVDDASAARSTEPDEAQKVADMSTPTDIDQEPETEGGAEVEEDGTVVKPLLFTGGDLRRYQIEGFNWLKVLYENGVNGILADEMGLGKTIQCIALLSHLTAMNVTGPFLVCAPLSTLPNWLSEFQRFAPKVPVLFYHGTKLERSNLRRKISKLTEVRRGVKVHPVVITSYEMTMIDRKFLQNYHWRYLIVDEGHRIKNTHCRLIKELRLYQNTHRLLLTGTPLQNNLTELWSLLNFLLPEIFDDLRSFETWFDVEQIGGKEAHEQIVQEEQRKNILSMLHQILMPFMLRRVKTDVDLQIPPKKEVLVYCSMTKAQEEFYTATVDKTIFKKIEEKNYGVEEEIVGRPRRKSAKKVDYSLMVESEKDTREPVNKQREEEQLEAWVSAIIENNKPVEKEEKKKMSRVTVRLQNIMMQLRKCCNHPYLLEYPLDPASGEYLVNNEVIRKSGKMIILDQMLTELKRGGHKVLLFSQMTKMLDILEDYCCHKKFQYCRLDGSSSLEERREEIESFNNDSEMFVFLLSTRAGGLGINLTAADTVILYDSDWNPQCDLQAQDRCHRIGQTKPVLVYRFVTANTIDQRIVERAAAKRKLEKMVIHKGKFKTGMKDFDTSLKIMNPEELMELLKSKDHNSEVSGRPNNKMSAADLAALLDRSDLIQDFKATKDRKNKGGKLKGKSAKKDTEKESKIFKVIDIDQGGSTLTKAAEEGQQL